MWFEIQVLQIAKCVSYSEMAAWMWTLLCLVLFGGQQGSQIKQIPTKYSQGESTKFLILTVVCILCIVGVLLASTVVYCLRHRSHHKLKEKLTNLGTDSGGDATATYQVGGVTDSSESKKKSFKYFICFVLHAKSF